jgi:hypothetical protein
VPLAHHRPRMKVAHLERERASGWRNLISQRRNDRLGQVGDEERRLSRGYRTSGARNTRRRN